MEMARDGEHLPTDGISDSQVRAWPDNWRNNTPCRRSLTYDPRTIVLIHPGEVGKI